MSFTRFPRAPNAEADFGPFTRFLDGNLQLFRNTAEDENRHLLGNGGEKRSLPPAHTYVASPETPRSTSVCHTEVLRGVSGEVPARLWRGLRGGRVQGWRNRGPGSRDWGAVLGSLNVIPGESPVRLRQVSVAPEDEPVIYPAGLVVFERR